VLTDAAIRGAKDDLLGLKENIIIGRRDALVEIVPPSYPAASAARGPPAATSLRCT
jgi:hypothetical protein